MIISPPFLPTRGAGVTDDAWISAAMPPAIRQTSTGAPEGSFPLSHNLTWHNGLHIAPPANQPVRAIADGKVIFAFKPAAENKDVADPQNYNPFDRDAAKPTAAWTDNGCIIVEHVTEIGAQGTAATVLTYYSLYMHLSDLARITPAGQTTKRQLQAGDSIWRKDEIGSAGQVYGNAGQIHFEICMNAANLQSLMGKAPAWTVPATATTPITVPTADGRTDSIFGSVYFYLPKKTPAVATVAMPTAHLRPTAAPAATLDEPMWVKMDYSAGHCTFTSYNASGTLIAALAPEPDAEYNLYTTAVARHNSLSPAAQATSSPSGWYELLRFGRNIGRGPADADKDPLPATAAHWRRIANPAGQAVWADLNYAGSHKFSEADFLALEGWNCVSDDTSPTDQRCDSINLKNLIRDPDASNTKRMEIPELAKRLGDATVQKKLKRAICKFPTEWDKDTVSARYNFVQELDSFTAAKASGNDMWPKLEKHLKAISFTGLPAGYTAADWHVHPKEFIELMRKCGWLNAMEFAQCFPRNQLHLNGTIFETETTSWATVKPIATRWSAAFNSANRRFGLSSSKQRLVHYFSHVIPETGHMQLMKEGDNKAGTYLTGKAYWPYYGRGLIQLTWLEGYKKYGTFRHFVKTITTGKYADLGWNPDDKIALNNTSYDAHNCADSACFYVMSHSSMARKMDAGITQTDAIAVSKCVNGDVAIQNLNGLEIRLQSILFLRNILADTHSSALSESMTFSWRRNSRQEEVKDENGKVVKDKNGNIKKKYFLRESPWTIDVPLNKQIP